MLCSLLFRPKKQQKNLKLQCFSSPLSYRPLVLTTFSLRRGISWLHLTDFIHFATGKKTIDCVVCVCLGCAAPFSLSKSLKGFTACAFVRLATRPIDLPAHHYCSYMFLMAMHTFVRPGLTRLLSFYQWKTQGSQQSLPISLGFFGFGKHSHLIVIEQCKAPLYLGIWKYCITVHGLWLHCIHV